MGVAWVRKFLWYGWLVALVAISVWIYIRSFLKIWHTVKVRQANRNHSLISIYVSHIRSDSNRSHAMLQECCVTSARAATKETSFMWGRNWNSYFAWFAGLWSFPRSSERLREVVIFAHTAQSAHFSVLFLFLIWICSVRFPCNLPDFGAGSCHFTWICNNLVLKLFPQHVLRYAPQVLR